MTKAKQDMNRHLLRCLAMAPLPAILLLLSSCSSRPTTPPEGSARISYAKGMPGGTIVQTVKVTALVTAIHKAERTATLLEPGSKELTVKFGPEAVNLDQIRVGDTVIATVVEKLVAALAEDGKTSADGTVAVAAMAPKGTQPGGVVAGVTQETAEIIAIDPTRRSATLRFEDGLTKTFPIRDDVDLSHGKLGDRVVFRFTEMIAIKVERPQ